MPGRMARNASSARSFCTGKLDGPAVLVAQVEAAEQCQLQPHLRPSLPHRAKARTIYAFFLNGASFACRIHADFPGATTAGSRPRRSCGLDHQAEQTHDDGGGSSSGSSRSPAVIGILMVVISTVAFAIVPSFARLAYDGGSNPLTLITVRSLSPPCVGLLILLPTGGWRRRAGAGIVGLPDGGRLLRLHALWLPGGCPVPAGQHGHPDLLPASDRAGAGGRATGS